MQDNTQTGILLSETEKILERKTQEERHKILIMFLPAVLKLLKTDEHFLLLNDEKTTGV